MKKRLILALALIMGLGIYLFTKNDIQRPILITEPGQYKINIENWTRQDSSAVYILVPGSEGAVEILPGSSFFGIGPAFIEIGSRKLFAGDWPKLIIRGVTAKGDINRALDLGNTMPWFLDAGGGNTGGMSDPIIEGNRIEQMGGIRWKKGKNGETGSIVGNHFVNIDQKVSDGQGGWLTQTEAEDATGTDASQFTRQGIVVGLNFSGPVKDIRIAYNYFDNSPEGYQTDIISFRADVDKQTIQFNGDGICVSSGATIENNVVNGNYHLKWNTPGVQQVGCAIIYDYDKGGEIRGGALFRENYVLSGSNTSFQHATYGVAYWDNNTSVSDGFYEGERVMWNGRAFGLYQPRALQKELPIYTRNRAAFMNTRFGGRLDYATRNQAGGHYPDSLYNKEKPYQNIHLYEGEIVTDWMEREVLDEAIQMLNNAGYFFYDDRPPTLPGDSIAPPPVDSCNTDSLLLIIDGLEKDRAELINKLSDSEGAIIFYRDENVRLRTVLDKIRELTMFE